MPVWVRAAPGLFAPLFHSGFGDGVYVSYVGRDAKGEAVAVVTGFGLLEGDETREGDQDAAEVREAAVRAAKEEEAARQRPRNALEDVVMRLNVELRTKGDMSEVVGKLADDVVLDRAGAKTKGRDAVVAALAKLPDELVLGPIGLPAPFAAEAPFTWRRGASGGGVVRVVVAKKGGITELGVSV